MNFKVGEKAVCIKEFERIDATTNEQFLKCKYPVIREIYTIVGFAETGFLILKGFSEYTAFDYNKFRKLDYEFVDRILTEIKEEQLTY